MYRSSFLLCLVFLCIVFFQPCPALAQSHHFYCDVGYWLVSTSSEDWEWYDTYYSAGDHIPAGTYTFYRGLENENFYSYLLKLGGIYEYSPQFFIHYGIEYALLDIGLTTRASIYNQDSGEIETNVLLFREEGPLTIVSLLLGFDYFWRDTTSTWSPFIGFYFTAGGMLDDLDDGYWSEVNEVAKPNPQYFIIPSAGIQYLMSPQTRLRVSVQYRQNTSSNYFMQGFSLNTGVIWRFK